ncbi:D-sedoheptulose-7-phosphate isomerase [Agarilytica rhodophyticola]|uniref:D-sedoheptulose-7-phosphate isomerase n=1 Tax=Agarilytica rhodophyticola TaxID=1737490 RepID=UPI000B348A4E|nr:D-sedoheptulose 7-phosphate isomerase [Agarilytica rhodophyticola]
MSHQNYIKTIVEQSISVKQHILSSAEHLNAIDEVAQLCVDAYKNGNKVLLAGNGGSAGDAQHIAAELVARFEFDRPGLPAIALTTDTSMLTAIGNDYGYDKVFSRQLEANAVSGDVFIGISTSGNSKNILEAFDSAKSKGVVCVGLCGQGGKILQVADHVLSVPSDCTARIQESHIMIGHILCGIIEKTMFE